MRSGSTTSDTGALIWSRIVEAQKDDMPPPAARYILKMDFQEKDHGRIERLATKAQKGTITLEERAEMEEYIRIADLLAIMQSKARRCLKRHGQGS